MTLFPKPAALTKDDEARLHARQTAERAAQNGAAPSERYSTDELAWAFEGYQAELEQLEEIATRRREAAALATQRRQEAEALRDETDAVLREWAAQAERDQRDRAEAEARRRLGFTA